MPLKMKLTAIIADDEPLARERLRFLLSGDEEICIVGECRNGREVVAALKDKRVDVLFLDIQMPGRGGFEVIEQVGPANMPVTIFVTAHNQFAVKAFEVHALDYLTKPVEPERLRATLARVKERIASSAALASQEQLKSVLESLANGSGARNIPGVCLYRTAERILSSTSTRLNGLRRRITIAACMLERRAS
jgi:two-component system LytT family response regulator